MSLRRRRQRGEKPKAAVDMTSLIDLTFLLLVTFIVTLPSLEQGIQVLLPQAKNLPKPPTKDNKANTITIDVANNLFLNDKPISFEDLEARLKAMAAEDPEVPVLVRGDERLDYGSVMRVVKMLYTCNVQKMALITKEQ